MTMDQPHRPVMLPQVLESFGDLAGKHIVDGTYGGGGYSRAILDSGASVTGFDRDPDAVANARADIAARNGRLSVIGAPFSSMGHHFAAQSVDGVVLDIGVSSMQLDQVQRGFAFRFDGPLDMRMGQTGTSAADVINSIDLSDLIRVIGILGEEKQASRIGRAIVDARSISSIKTTGQLAAIVEKAVPRKHSDAIHPATKTFQALRIFVNDELRELARALFAAERILVEDGVLVVVSFHSLEDRIVKQFLASRSGKAGGSRHLPQQAEVDAVFVQDGKPVIAASEVERDLNPRARSAKLRAARRTDAAALKVDMALFKFARLPWPQDTIKQAGALS